MSAFGRYFTSRFITANEIANKVDEAYGEIKEKKQNPQILFSVSDKKTKLK